MNNTIASIVQAKKIITENNIPIWLDGGTLLGWARHCGVVSVLLTTSLVLQHFQWVYFLDFVRKK